MENDFIFWKHTTPVGVRIEEVSGGEEYPAKIRQEMAMQIFCEHGPESYREIMHFNSGAPVIKGLDARISIAHTPGLYVVGFLPRTPDDDLSVFNPHTAMGIDAEKFDREKVMKVRERFLSEKELDLIPEDDLKANILAWTAKEAILKASLNPAIDFRNDIILEKLPKISDNPVKETSPELGEATLILRNEDKTESFPMKLYSYDSDGYCVTIALSPKCATFKPSVI